MTTNPMRRYIDAIDKSDSSPIVLDEGVIDSIKKWISGLSDPIKKRGQEMVKDLENRLKTKYGAKIPDQVKKSNKGWMWSRITYRDLFNYATQVQGVTVEELDRALRNPIVTNNLKQVIKTLPPDVDAPALPLKGATMNNNTNYISPTIDKGSNEYLSKAIAVAVLDGIAYIEQAKKDQEADSAKAAEKSQAEPTPSAPGATPDSGSSATATPGTTPSTPDDIKAAIAAIKQGLAKMKGAA